jgi:hypothetical protein
MDSIAIKPLDIEIGHDGRKLHQLHRTGNIAMYELRNEQGLLLGYEVIKTRIQKETERYGNILAEREIYPCDSQFGSMGWSFGKDHKIEANEKFKILVNLEQNGFTPTGAPTVERGAEPASGSKIHSTALATEFRHSGRTYTQLRRDGNVALYKLSGAGYEVVIVRRQKPKMIHR